MEVEVVEVEEVVVVVVSSTGAAGGSSSSCSKVRSMLVEMDLHWAAEETLMSERRSGSGGGCMRAVTVV